MRLLRAVAVLSFVACLACAGGMQNIKDSAQSGACDASCDQAKNECVEKCAGDADQPACELACDAAQKKCADDCKE